MNRISTAIGISLFKIKALLRRTVKKLFKSTHAWDDSISVYAPAGLKLYWETLTEISRYQNEQMTGNPDMDILAFTQKHIQSVCGTSALSALSIGCLEQENPPEFKLIRTGWFNKIDVVDIATGLLEKQKSRAVKSGFTQISYNTLDVNTVELNPETYDFIWGIGTIHHIDKQSNLFFQINRALKPGGLFMMREYIGPNRLQLVAKQKEIANKILRTIPLKFRWKWYLIPKTSIKCIPLEKLIKDDPSEAVNSESIMTEFSRHLEPLLVRETGGGLLHPLLNEISFNFEQSPEGISFLKELIELEKSMTANGELNSDYVFCLGKKRQQ